MANDTTGLMQTLLASATEASASLKYRNALVEAIYWDYQPYATAQPFQTLNVTVPTVDEGDISDAQGGPYSPSDTKHTNVAITLDKDFTTSFIIRNWDEIRTPDTLRTKYVQPRLESLLRKVNKAIFNIINSTNFNSYSSVDSSSNDFFVRADLTTAWANLAAGGCPVDDTENLFFITHPVPVGNMLAQTTWQQESIVGVDAAVAANQRAQLKMAYGFSVLWDQHFALAAWTSGKYPAIAMHRYAIAGVTVTPLSEAPNKVIVFPRPGLPVLIEADYSIKDRGWVVGMTCQFGVKVVRPEFGNVMQTA